MTPAVNIVRNLRGRRRPPVRPKRTRRIGLGAIFSLASRRDSSHQGPGHHDIVVHYTHSICFTFSFSFIYLLVFRWTEYHRRLPSHPHQSDPSRLKSPLPSRSINRRCLLSIHRVHTHERAKMPKPISDNSQSATRQPENIKKTVREQSRLCTR
jgi:hypothetical protein